MKSLGYIWVVVINLVAVGAVFAIYDALTDSFEIIVVSLLVLIYINIQAFLMRYSITTGQQALFQAKQFIRIKHLIRGGQTGRSSGQELFEKYERIAEDHPELVHDFGDPEGEADDEEEEEELSAATEQFNKGKNKMAITDGFLLLIYVIVLWNLISALSS